jgi:hypothetical protein
LLSHLRSYERYDEPETLPYSIRPFCPMSADGGHEEHPLAEQLGNSVHVTVSTICRISFVCTQARIEKE